MRATTSITYLSNELIAAESFHTLGEGSTLLRIEHGGETIEIEFVVSNDVEGQPPNQLGAKALSSERLRVQLINFRSLIRAQLGPVEVGTLAHRKATLVVDAAASAGTESKRISYSLYLGD